MTVATLALLIALGAACGGESSAPVLSNLKMPDTATRGALTQGTVYIKDTDGLGGLQVHIRMIGTATMPTTTAPVYGVSAAGVLGIDAFLRRLGESLARGLRLVQLREPGLSSAEVDRLFGEMRSMTRAAGARLLVNSRHPRALWQAADGVHLTSSALAVLGERPALDWVGASVHDAKELARAGEMGVDFAVLGPVQSTTSHPGQAHLGWTEFERLAIGTPVPLYAIGGLDGETLPLAMACGAHGVALLSAAWRADQCFERSGSVGGVSSACSAGPPGTT